MLKDWINPKYLDINTLKKLREDFLNMEWTKVLFLEDFLQEEKFEQLSDEVFQYPLEKEVFSDMYDNYVSPIPKDSFWYRYLTECIESEQFKKIFSFLVGNSIDTLGTDFSKVNFLKGDENFFHWHTDYQPGSPLKDGTSRLYLHKHWKEEYGGELELWRINLDTSEHQKFDDIWNLWISFQSERFEAYFKKVPTPNTLFYLKIQKDSFHRIGKIHTDIPRYTLGQKWYKKAYFLNNSKQDSTS